MEDKHLGSSFEDFYNKEFEESKESKEYQFEYCEIEKVSGKNKINNGVLKITWGCNIGFGQTTFVIRKDGKLHIDTECMGKDFVKQALNYIIDNHASTDVEE